MASAMDRIQNLESIEKDIASVLQLAGKFILLINIFLRFNHSGFFTLFFLLSCRY